jgi:Fe-S cluster biogenesis protein NfuA
MKAYKSPGFRKIDADHDDDNDNEREMNQGGTMKEKVEAALNKIRPMLQADGGNVELLGVDETDGVVRVRLQGACAGCPMSQMTLKNGIERILKEQIPEVTRVENVPG